jgi:hypothetical protein
MTEAVLQQMVLEDRRRSRGTAQPFETVGAWMMGADTDLTFV